MIALLAWLFGRGSGRRAEQRAELRRERERSYKRLPRDWVLGPPISGPKGCVELAAWKRFSGACVHVTGVDYWDALEEVARRIEAIEGEC